ncbi:MAG: hypothetical protein ABR867_01235 [Nitrososphaerales archaeon]
MHPGRILGIVMGLVILATIFLIPFAKNNNLPHSLLFSNSGDTLYGIVSPWMSNLGQLQSAGDTAALTYAYLFVIAFILLVIAGVVGIFPLGTGVLGVVGMAMVTASPSLVYPSGPVTLSPSVGFYIMWAASVISLGASFWHGKKEAVAPVSVTVTQSQVVGTPATPANTVKCPSCQTMNAADATKCSKCGMDLPGPA